MLGTRCPNDLEFLPDCFGLDLLGALPKAEPVKAALAELELVYYLMQAIATMKSATTPNETPIETPSRVFVLELKIASHYFASDYALRLISISSRTVPQQDSKH
jgi:hypothetical protein